MTDLSSSLSPSPSLKSLAHIFLPPDIRNTPFLPCIVLFVPPSPAIVQWPCLFSGCLSLCDSNELDGPARGHYTNTSVTKHQNTLCVDSAGTPDISAGWVWSLTRWKPKHLFFSAIFMFASLKNPFYSFHCIEFTFQTRKQADVDSSQSLPSCFSRDKL